MNPNKEHKCTPQCEAWHKIRPPRGRRANSIPKGDPRHTNEASRRKHEEKMKNQTDFRKKGK